jgi:hypothetical protein
MKSIFITAFVIYILWVVLYLLWERFSRRPGKQRQVSQEIPSRNSQNDDIMGKSTFDLRHSLPEATKPENQKNGIQKEDSFAALAEVKPPAMVPDKELDETFSHNRDDNQPMGISVPLEYDSNSHGDNLSEEEDEESWLPGNITLAEGSTFEEMGAAVRTVVHYSTATSREKEQAGGTLLEIRQTDMFEQLVQSEPGRRDIVSQVISLHLAAYHRRSDESIIVVHDTTGGEVPGDFDIKDFV